MSPRCSRKQSPQTAHPMDWAQGILCLSLDSHLSKTSEFSKAQRRQVGQAGIPQFCQLPGMSQYQESQEDIFKDSDVAHVRTEDFWKADQVPATITHRTYSVFFRIVSVGGLRETFSILFSYAFL